MRPPDAGETRKGRGGCEISSSLYGLPCHKHQSGGPLVWRSGAETRVVHTTPNKI